MKKMRIFFAAMLVVLLLCGAAALPVAAADDVVSGEWGDLTWELDKTTGHLTISGSGEMEDFPYSSSTESFRAYKASVRTVAIDPDVTSLGNYAFYAFESLTGVTLGENSRITDIGSYAFAGCEKLESFEIPEGVTAIGNYAFNGCKLLTGVEIPSAVSYVGDSAFTDCDELIEQVGGVKYVGKWALGCDESATSIVLRDGTVGIGESAFAFCGGLESVTLPSGVKYIVDYAFLFCESLAGIEIPSSVTEIGHAVLSGCPALAEIEVERENSVYHSSGNCLIKTADKTLIAGCKASVIPADGSVLAIGESAFEECVELASIEIPSCVTRVDSSAFSGCVDLIRTENGVGYVDGWVISCEVYADTVVLASDTVGIADGAFASCKYLEKAQYMGCKTAWDAVKVGSDNENLTEILEFVGHAITSWTVTVEATEVSDGLREGVCVCGEKVTEVIPKLPKTDEPTASDDAASEDEGLLAKVKALIPGCQSVTGGAFSIALMSLSAALVAMKKKSEDE